MRKTLLKLNPHQFNKTTDKTKYNQSKTTRPTINIVSAMRSLLLFLFASLAASVQAQTASETTVCFDNPSGFGSPYVYFWNPQPEAPSSGTAWPGEGMEALNDLFCFDPSVGAASLNVIFNNQGAQQTGDLVVNGANRCWRNGQWESLQDCGFSFDDTDDNSDGPDPITNAILYFKNDSAYNQPYVHYFDVEPATPASQWPGQAMQPLGDDWYSFEFPNSVDSAGVVFNDNGAPQTQDLVFTPQQPCYQNGAFVTVQECDYDLNPTDPVLNPPTGKAIFMVNTQSWQDPHAYIWNVNPDGLEDDFNWPGEALTAYGVNDLYYIEINDLSDSGNIIFSDQGNNQTADLNFSGQLLCFNQGEWVPPAECGVIESDNLELAQLNQSANRGSQIALTLPKNEFSGAATWRSQAWGGETLQSESNGSVVTPPLGGVGSYVVEVEVDGKQGEFTLEVVSAIDGLPTRPLLAKELNFPLEGNVASGNYEFEIAFPNIADLFISPVQVLNDGVNDLIYVVDKPGVISVFPNDINVNESQVVQLLDFRDEVRDNHEQGFLSMAFHPQFAQNRYAYIYYIEGENDDPSSGGRFDDGVLQRITLDNATNPTTVVADSRVDVLRVPQVGNDHKGGKMEFHPESGLFYMSIGDGAYAATAGDPVDPNDPRKNNAAQETDNLLGTFIRIEMLDSPENGQYYRIPSDNPFVNNPSFRGEIWSYGHRNPWRWSFQQTPPYTLWETEVGQAGFEEVNIIEPGKNYGWPICEGETHRGQAGGDLQVNRSCTNDLEGPVEGYFHSTGSVSIIGGIVYNGNKLPALRGKFLFGDYISKNIWTLEEGENKALLSDGFPSNIVSFGTDVSGDDILVSTYGLEFGVSGIYRIVDRDAAAAVIPSKLSETGIFADLPTQFPVSGVVEYEVNSTPWFDDAQIRFFVSVPNDQTIEFEQEDLWDLPVGSVLVKHTDLQGANSETYPFETSVLFKQQTGWEAANYRWNEQGTDANLVVTTQQEQVTDFSNGTMRTITRTVRAGGECSSCHTGLGGKNPRGIKTQQFNRSFSYQGVISNQLDVFSDIGLFDQGLLAASNYLAYVDPDDSSADLNERARVYLDTNCSSCHAGSLMNLKYGVPLAEMDIMNRQLAGEQYRMLPFNHDRSVLHTFQVSDGNRMPRGTVTTNPMADELFADWIDAESALLTNQEIEVRSSSQDIRVGQEVTIGVSRVFDNGFEQEVYEAANNITWDSSNSGVIDLSTNDGSSGQISFVPRNPGVSTITAIVDGLAATRTFTVESSAYPPLGFNASALSSSAISLNWSNNPLNDVSTTSYSLLRSDSVAGGYQEIASISSGINGYVDSGLDASSRYYYRLIAISSEGSSSPVETFTDTNSPSTVESLRIESGNSFDLLESENRQLVALAEVADQLEGVTSSATWNSSNSSIVSVSASGLLSGGSQIGTATITAEYEGEIGQIEISNQGPGTYLYFNNQSESWAEVRAYVFATSNGNESAQTGAWPGALMEPSIEYGGKWLRIAIPESLQGQQQTEVVFNCGSATCKTNDLLINTSVRQQWFSENQWLATEPNGAGAVSVGTQLVTNNGEVFWANNGSNLTGRLITPGAVVDVVADQVGAGQQFKQWEGSAAPYILNPSSPNTKMLVPSALSLTMNGVFDTIADENATGRDYYSSSQTGCAGCHGADGQGTPPLTNLSSKYTLAELTGYIAGNMPLGNTSTCVGECASSIAEMLLAEAFTEPDGLCRFDDLQDVIPADRSNRLLTLYEYNNSVRDILNLSSPVDVTSAYLPATIPLNGFKTAANTKFTDEYAQGYLNAATEVADLVNNDLFSLAPDCGGDLVCAINSAGKRVFRRPVTEEERDELLEVHSVGGERAVIINLFSAPSMLYRSEVGEFITSGVDQGYYKLTDYEVATLLSYTFWGTTPDAWLMQLADRGELSSNEQIRSAVQVMLNDERAEFAFERFVEGWMELDKEIGTRTISDSLKEDMKEETMRFVKNTFFNDGTYQQLMTADYSFMTQQLAEHYGIAWPGGGQWQQIFYSGDNNERRGVLGHASVLTIQSAQEKTHPVKRGLFVRKNLMCQEFPPPPLGAALDPESDPTKGVRHRFEVAHAQPGCDACHQYIDGIGFGLESYNAFGQFVRNEATEDGTVLPIDSSGYIGSLSSAETFLSSSDPVFDYQGLDQLVGLIIDSAHGRSCFARQWFRYATGKRESADDSCTLQAYSNDFKSDADMTLKDLVIDFTQTRNYTLRK